MTQISAYLRHCLQGEIEGFVMLYTVLGKRAVNLIAGMSILNLTNGLIRLMKTELTLAFM